MEGPDLIAIVDLLESSGVQVWLDGGWGVDALLGEQTRPHKDADVIVQVVDVPAMVDLLGTRGFSLTEGCPASNFVLEEWARPAG